LKAENPEIGEVDGKRYLDFAMGIAVCNTRHCHPKVMAAAKAQIDAFAHTSFQVSMYEPYIELAEKINDIAPIDNAKSVFFSTGAEAVENTVRIARIATGRVQPASNQATRIEASGEDHWLGTMGTRRCAHEKA